MEKFKREDVPMLKRFAHVIPVFQSILAKRWEVEAGNVKQGGREIIDQRGGISQPAADEETVSQSAQRQDQRLEAKKSSCSDPQGSEIPNGPLLDTCKESRVGGDI